jgi:uncharacterized protein YjbI with pentapeptide repeats
MMPDLEQVAVLMEGVDAWNLWRSKHPHVRPNLRDFSTRELHRGILGLDLTKANFENADFQGAGLYRCWLVEANFVRADLRGAILGEVTAGGAHFDRAKMRAVMMKGTYFGATFKHTDFIVPAHQNRTFDLERWYKQPTMLNDADLRDCDFTRAKLQAAVLKGVNLRGANLAHANLRDANLEFVQLIETNVEGTDFHGCKICGLSAIGLQGRPKDESNLTVKMERSRSSSISWKRPSSCQR